LERTLNRVVTVIMPENTASLRHAKKTQYHLFAAMGYIKLGKWRRGSCRVKEGIRSLSFSSCQSKAVSWDHIAQSFRRENHYLDAFLGKLKKQAHLSLIERRGGLPKQGRVLKTDLFEEAMGADSLLPELSSAHGLTVGMDVAVTITHRAQANSTLPTNAHLVADVRHLPFADSSFALIISPSTLDHFPDPSDLGKSLRELARVLSPEGRLIITLDNRQNIFDPLLRLANRLKLTPYYLGRSYTIKELCTELEAAGFTVEDTTAILHNPRLVAVAIVRLARILHWPLFTRLIQQGLIAAQRFEYTRWRYFTGSFVAAKAVRKSRSLQHPSALATLSQ